MRTTSNPAFRNLPVGGGGYAGFDSAPASFPGADPRYGGALPTTSRPMTVDDVVIKTGITLAVLAATGVATYLSGLWQLALPAALIGFVLALVIILKRLVSPPLILAYAAVEGVFLGGISGAVGTQAQRLTGSSSIVLEAVAGTLLVFAGMLVVYKTGAVKVTPRFTKWLTGALIGVVGLMVVNLIANFFVPGGLHLRDGGPLAIVFSLVCIGIAAFSFLVDFDTADQAIRAGAPEKTAWYIAFGLTVTLVWLYLEILRLLSYLQSE
ncbi:MAG: Bax inhibitor-1/YccA family protein [Pseudonocardiales bacterium]|nr:Bax inhibitor-1/YccA family protein [Pseudonocardiales bacterium]MBV9032727.1 Bax inhibitor-1/YccA family protein [Pseudonocardiales bacterium]